jgi:hypothetical protein
MVKGINLTLMIGPLVPIPVPQSVLDALTSVEVTTKDKGPSGFQLSFSLSKKSPLHTLFLLSGGAPLLFMRVVIVVTLKGTPDVIMDGVITNHQIAPGSDTSHPTLVITGEDLTALMNQQDFSRVPFPAMPAEGRVALLLLKYAVFGITPLIVPSILIDIPLPTGIIRANGAPIWPISRHWPIGWATCSISIQAPCRASTKPTGDHRSNWVCRSRLSTSTWTPTPTWRA